MFLFTGVYSGYLISEMHPSPFRGPYYGLFEDWCTVGCLIGGERITFHLSVLGSR